jgi:predicted dehydrogenase
VEPIDLILVGCGLMGGRHLRGYGELERVRPGSLRLRAVCDLRPEAAERVAAETEGLLGYRPAVCATAEEALAREPGIAAADVVTEPRTHPDVVIPLLESGVHVQVEKPLSVSVAAGRRMVGAAGRAGRILSVAENYRRDPMNRLLRHVVRSGAIGEPCFLLDVHVQDGRRVVVSPWRHEWRNGGIVLDMGIHYADMVEYLMGPVTTVSALSRRVRETREWTAPDGSVQVVPVECDDLYTANLTFESGAQGAFVMHFGGAGEGQAQRTVHGTAGSVSGPPDRSGKPVRMHRGGEVLEGQALVEALPEFRLPDTEARLFGERPGCVEILFAQMDAGLIAVETADFLDAIREGRPPELDGEGGLRSVALVMALLESSHQGQPVRIPEVLSGAACEFQHRIGH